MMPSREEQEQGGAAPGRGKIDELVGDRGKAWTRKAHTDRYRRWTRPSAEPRRSMISGPGLKPSPWARRMKTSRQRSLRCSHGTPGLPPGGLRQKPAQCKNRTVLDPALGVTNFRSSTQP